MEGRGAADLVAESRALVSCYSGPYAAPWHYRGEDARRDMRGFRVDHLSTDPKDALLDDPSAPPLPMEQERADHVLTNGARLYNDHGHPEYSTPECSTIMDVVVHDRAGESIVLDCAKVRMERGSGKISLFKNNTDFHGSTYGCHENYLMARSRPFGEVLNVFLPYLSTRIIFTGAGKVGHEPKSGTSGYQLSQRADFFTEEASVDTLHRRPIFNTRDEPHADARDWRRLHVISGDANICEYAAALKMGATSLVVKLAEDGWVPEIRLRDPVGSFRSISRDESLRWIVETEDGKSIRATDVQWMYHAAAEKRYAGYSADADWTLRSWRETIALLEEEPAALADRVDWVAKKILIDQYKDSEGELDDDHLQSIDLAYSNIDPHEGFREMLEQGGHMIRLSTEDSVMKAKKDPPETTRAAIRGYLVSHFSESLGSIGWSGAVIRQENESWFADLAPFLMQDRIDDAMVTLREARDLEGLIAAFKQ